MRFKKFTAMLTTVFMLSVCVSPAVFADGEDTAEAVVLEQTEEEMTVNTAAAYPYQNTSLSFEERAADLVARMTLAEKAAQTAAKSAPAISRLGVHSYYYWREGIHGVARQGRATSFPSSLAMSNTWDRQLVYETMDITSTEARGKNNRYDLNYWNPTINLARDPRWGRNEESYGEDPYLTAEIGGNAVKGMEGTDEKYKKTITTLKHYAANNCEGERQTGTSVMNERTMREYYARAFGDIIENYHPGAVMSSYNGTTIYRNGEILEAMDGQKIDYIASSANSYLLNDLLRRVYGFDGFVVGDCGAWDNAFGRQPLRQKLYPNEALDNITATMTVSKIIGAGSSLDCNSGANGTAQVLAAVQSGLISEDVLDIAVYELFLQRMKTGEFDSGAKYQNINSSVLETEASHQKAIEAAEKSWVLLENDGTLPLKNENGMKIAVVGNYANQVVLGDYSANTEYTEQYGPGIKEEHLITPLDGITEEIKKLDPNANVQLIGNISDQTALFNIKNIWLVRNGKDEKLDLSKVTTAIGMTKGSSGLTNITPAGMAVIPSVNFKDVSEVKIEASSFDGMPNVTVEIGYGSSSQNAANVSIANTASTSDYQINSGIYNGATGGYVETRDMYINVKASADFSVENYKTVLDGMDYIIAYGGTTTSDSSESRDRSSIDLPATQSHVQQICDAYPDKTIVALQTVGQVNVEGFKDKCAAMLWTSYNGQAQGLALGRILTGAVNPSGKLSTTWYPVSDLEKMPIGSARQNINGIDYNFTNYELSFDINNKEAVYPGRTYQYYSGTPVYPFGYGKSYTTFEYSSISVDKTAADANDIITVTADVENKGTVSGTEVAQLYVTVPGADGKTLPFKQLKGFERVTLAAGEKKTVTFKLDISDVYFFDEAAQKNYVVNGAYTLRVGGSSNDSGAVSASVSVSGTIAETLKNIYAIPSGLKLYIAKDASGAKPNEPANTIYANANVTLKDDRIITDFAADNVSVTYTSSNPSIAVANADGTIKAGGSEGVATITVTASKAGSESVSFSFPVVTSTVTRITDSKKAEYVKRLEDAYANCPEIAYTPENRAVLDGIYNEAHAFLESELVESNIPLKLETAIKEITAIPRIPTEESYTVASVNPEIIKNGVIDYSAAGIGEYTAGKTEVSGTITEAEPREIELQALNGGSKVTSELIWTVEKLDGSTRRAPEIDMRSGKLKIYENGVFKVTASDYPNQKSGSIVVYANLQIEGESADASGGAKLDDIKAGASNAGGNAGSTKTYWLRYDGVKLDKLTGITLRVSQQSTAAKANISLMGNSDWVFATADVPVTGAWTNWTEVTATVDRNELSKLTLDENGCGTVFIQTNASNLDYIRLRYNDSDVDAICAAGGAVKISEPYDSGVILAAAYRDGKLTASKTMPFTEAGSYTLDGFSGGDSVSVFTWNSLDKMQPLAAPVTLTYKEPTVKKLTVYNFSDSVFDSFFDTAEGTKLSSGLGMDGDGGWNTDKGGSYKYNGRTYTFTRSLKGGKGEEGARRVYFTPEADGVVTAIFNAGTTREMNIQQGSSVKTQTGTGKISHMQMNVKAGERVYVYGGGSNKLLYAVLFEAGEKISGDVETPSPSPSNDPNPSPSPSNDPLPEIIHQFNVQFETSTKSWTTGSGTEAAGTGTVVNNTKDGDIFYFGEQSMDGLAAVDLSAAIRDDAGTAHATLYAVDMTGIDVNSLDKNAAGKLLTSANQIGEKTRIIATPGSWSTYNSHVFRFSTSGQKGIFVKLNTTGKYCGNFDYMTFIYAAASAQTLSAENDLAIVSVAGDEVTALSKYDGTVSILSYNSEYGKNAAFRALENWNGMIAALTEDNVSGKTELVTSATGEVWTDATPTYFSEKDTGAPGEPVINSLCPVGDQIYLGCDGGWLITMTPCSKCSTLKKVCDFDITAVEQSDDTLILSGDNREQVIDISAVRQSRIEAEAALNLVSQGAKLVDVRSEAEFAAASYDGSENVPIDEFEEWISQQSDDTPIIVFCESGLRAARAVKLAKSAGYTNIYNLGSITKIK